VCLHDAPVQRKQFVELLLLARGQMHPARQQQPAFTLHQLARRSEFTDTPIVLSSLVWIPNGIACRFGAEVSSLPPRE